jgi:hypothetical protein
MSRSRVGLIIAGDSNSLKNDTVYSSQRSKLTVDPDAEPAHFDLLENFSGGTKFSIADTDETVHEEILFQVRHNLPFKPQIQAYFYPTSVPSGAPAPQAQYSMNMQLMLYNAIALGDEWIEADADETYFYIKHKAQRFNFGGPNPYVFYGSDFQFRIRYFIFNQPSYLIDGGIAPQS